MKYFLLFDAFIKNIKKLIYFGAHKNYFPWQYISFTIVICSASYTEFIKRTYFKFIDLII